MREKKGTVSKSKRPLSLADKASTAVGYALDTGVTDEDHNGGRRRAESSSSYSYRKRRRKRQGGGGYSHNKNKAHIHNVDMTSNLQTPKENYRDGVQRTFRNVTNGNGDADANGDNRNSNERKSANASEGDKGCINHHSSKNKSLAIATPAYLRGNNFMSPAATATATASAAISASSTRNDATSSKTSTKSNPLNPYNRDRYAPPSSAKPNRRMGSSTSTSTHVICAISENLARETCIATMDAGSPVVLEVHKLSNGQRYAETISFLELKCPHEILLNEGRRNSQLCQKIQELFGNLDNNDKRNDSDSDNDDNDMQVLKTPKSRPSSRPDLTGACIMKTVVKFVPRSYFDQNKGADILRRVAREGAYDASIVEEYILLSSSHAILQYLQICLGANFCRNSLDICMHWGGKNRMAIDRCSIAHLELLANAKTGKAQNSLIGTVDCTKTTVGSRLLRSNLMSPPTRIDTINARLDLVDTFLEDEQFFYEILQQLMALPDVEKMLAHMALSPRKNVGKRSMFGDKRQVTARKASQGISALVCIKSALSVIPDFARVLDIQLKSLVKRDRRKRRKVHEKKVHGTLSAESNTNFTGTKSCAEKDGDNSQKEADDSDLSSNSDSEDSQSFSSDSQGLSMGEKSETPIEGSLLIGLGGGGGEPASLDSHSHQLLRAIMATMKNPALQEILDAVMNIFTESTSYSKNSHAMRHQECFALKPNTDGMMDVLRKAFLANVDDIYKLADEYAESNGFAVTVKETTARGYYLSIPVKSVTGDLPPTFIQPVKTGRFINCTTEEVLSLSSRAQENVQDLLLMTHDRIQEVIDIARQKYDALASLSDAIALIDMCHGFADNVASSRLPWCRPVVTDCSSRIGSNEGSQNNNIVGSGSIAIRNGRYAIDVSNSGLMTSQGFSNNTDFVPNDTYASSFQNFTVITGINGSGKSTYLKQLAITVILAHCGSYVPAEEAFIPIRDRICTRIGNSDDQEHNISTFMQEMKDTAFICKNATDKSLILIDELGRATSNEDGVAIAWAIGEFLLIKRAMTFFVTHYPQLCRLADVYPNVQNQHLGATIEKESGEVRYIHKIMPGSCRMSADYGVEMAATCGWQSEVVEMARKIRAEVESKLPDGVLCQTQVKDSHVDTIAIRHKAESILNDLAKNLVALKASEERLSEDARRSYLQDLRDQYGTPDDQDVVEMMKKLLLDNTETVTPSLPLRPEGLICINQAETSCSQNDMIMETVVENAEAITTSPVLPVFPETLDCANQTNTSYSQKNTMTVENIDSVQRFDAPQKSDCDVKESGTLSRDRPQLSPSKRIEQEVQGQLIVDINFEAKGQTKRNPEQNDTRGAAAKKFSTQKGGKPEVSGIDDLMAMTRKYEHYEDSLLNNTHAAVDICPHQHSSSRSQISSVENNSKESGIALITSSHAEPENILNPSDEESSVSSSTSSSSSSLSSSSSSSSESSSSSSSESSI
eukprot:CAMPEP_0194105350 /NCGR_PEP_ID=MMETSP0150-20130528/5553_1 /TAXON_ID=122233 /ORGANISM="Chaetoceros debilis, Strain MM31A-1" /LENGTH=1464 /DNA_ID=CAMNT_0038793161 /DNA_START=358 /DNA_END=4752 /DNA_ORIENTATION=+